MKTSTSSSTTDSLQRSFKKPKAVLFATCTSTKINKLLLVYRLGKAIQIREVSHAPIEEFNKVNVAALNFNPTEWLDLYNHSDPNKGFTRVNNNKCSLLCLVVRVASPKSREGRTERGYHNQKVATPQIYIISWKERTHPEKRIYHIRIYIALLLGAAHAVPKRNLYLRRLDKTSIRSYDLPFLYS